MKRGPKLNLIKKMGKGGGTETKTVCQTVSNEVKYKKCNYLHNVEHVVQPTFQNKLITF